MKPNNVCMECGKVYSKVPKRCMCGCYFTQENTRKIDKSKCHYFTNGEQCIDPGTVTFWARSNDWFCGFHARKLREESFKR